MQGIVERLFVKDRQFYRTALVVAAPIVAQGMITVAVNMLDTFMLGSYGEGQISASSLCNEFINIYFIMCLGLGFGAAVLTAQYWGKGDIPALKKVTAIMLRMTLVLSLVFWLVTLFYPQQIMRLFTDDPDIIANSLPYFRYMAWSYPLLGVSQTLTAIMRSVRQVRLPLYVSVLAFFLNLFFNWVFIYGNLGAPEMQIGGAALATLLCRVVEFCIIGGYFLFVDQKVGFRILDLFRSCRGYFMLYIKYSMPVFVSDCLLGFGNSAVAMVMGRIGASYVAANAIVSQIMRLCTVFNQGVSGTSAVMTGNTLGEGDTDRAYRQGVTFVSLSLLIGILAGVVILLISPLVVSLFNITGETRQIADQLMYSTAIMAVFQAMQGVLTKGVLRGGGDTRFLMIADVLFLWLVSLPLGYFVALVLHLPAFWVNIALKADWIIKSVWCLFRLRSRKWIRVIAA